MARVLARRDQSAGYVFFRSLDGYAIPAEVRDVLKANSGDYSGEAKEWRVPLARGAQIVEKARSWGHELVTIDAGSVRAAPRPVECADCGQPYRASKVPTPGELCAAGGHVLELVHPPEQAA